MIVRMGYSSYSSLSNAVRFVDILIISAQHFGGYGEEGSELTPSPKLYSRISTAKTQNCHYHRTTKAK